jgi:hypothetical protein
MKTTDLPETARETVKTVKVTSECWTTSLKRGVNETLELSNRQTFQLVDTLRKVKFTNALLAPDSRIS